MSRKSLFLLMMGFLGWQSGLLAEEIPAPLSESLAKIVPGTQPDRVSSSPIPGLYEVVFGPHIVYVSADGRYLVQGDVVDLEKRENLTAEKRKRARLEAVNGLGENSMIVFVPQKVKHTITVFTDIDCPYCAKLHREVGELNDLGVKVRYVAYPRAGIPSPSYDKTVSVWCADDPKKAIGDAKFGKPVPEKRCENPVKDHYALGQSVGVSGTPAIMLEDGELLPGYVPAKRLVRIIEAGAEG